MADGRFYWLKLKRDFFKRHDVRIVEEMPNGKDYILFYLKLLCESVDHEGCLRFSKSIPYNAEMLATITNTNVDIVQAAVKVFSDLNMMEVFDDGTLFMTEVNAMIGSAVDSPGANRVRRFRENQKEQALLPAVTKCNADVTGCVTENNESKSKSIEKELDIKENVKEKTSRFSPPTLEEIQAYIREKGFNVDAERFFDYYTSNGWKVGKNPMKSWEATVRNWARDSKQEEPKPKGAVSYDLERANQRKDEPIVYKPKAERNTPTRTTGSADIPNEHDNHTAREYDAELKRKIAALRNDGGT